MKTSFDKADYDALEKEINELMRRRGVLRNTIVMKRFVRTLIREFVCNGIKFGDLEAVLQTLKDETNLFPGSRFSQNFKLSLVDFISSLKKNKTFIESLKELVGVTGKGVGVGEALLALLVMGWKYSTDGDGLLDGEKKEVKGAKGSSLKPIAGGLTDKGLVDKLNEKYWRGLHPGGRKKGHEQFRQIARGKRDQFVEYLGELYPAQPVEHIANKVYDPQGNFCDIETFQKVAGLEILKWYKEIEGFTSLILINPDTLEVINIAKIDESIFGLGINFKIIMRRNKDTQASPDGYAVISCK